MNTPNPMKANQSDSKTEARLTFQSPTKICEYVTDQNGKQICSPFAELFKRIPALEDHELAAPIAGLEEFCSERTFDQLQLQFKNMVRDACSERITFLRISEHFEVRDALAKVIDYGFILYQSMHSDPNHLQQPKTTAQPDQKAQQKNITVFGLTLQEMERPRTFLEHYFQHFPIEQWHKELQLLLRCACEKNSYNEHFPDPAEVLDIKDLTVKMISMVYYLNALLDEGLLA